MFLNFSKAFICWFEPTINI